MLKEYTSKPVTVLACEIMEEGKIEKGKKPGVCIYTHKGKGAITTLLEFTVSTGQKALPGDFIIKLADDDIYLCKKEVFEAKYGIKGMVIR